MYRNMCAVLGLVVLTCLFSNHGLAQEKRPEPPQQQGTWKERGQAAIARAARLRGPGNQRARNVILFVGDGMGISTITAARILEGQRRGETGEENQLSFEQLPYLALVKTYSI